MAVLSIVIPILRFDNQEDDQEEFKGDETPGSQNFPLEWSGRGKREIRNFKESIVCQFSKASSSLPDTTSFTF